MAVCSIRIIICLQVACYCIYGIHLPLPFEFEGNPYDTVKIIVRDDGSRFRRSADGIIIPAKNLEVSFLVQQHPVTLRLYRNDDLTPEVPVYTANEDGVIKEDMKDDHKAFFYQDVSNGAAVFVHTTQSSYCLFGSFFLEDGEFFLEPNQRECTDLLVNSTFRVWRSNFSEIQNFDIIDRDIVDDYEPIFGKVKGRFKRNVADLKIETLIIIDYSIYSYWYSRVTVKKESDRPRTTRSVIRQFYAFVINGMDVRFKNIPPMSSGFTLSVVFSGIFIADNEANSPFTEDHRVTSVIPNQVDADVVLNHTTTWLQQQTGLSGFDHAMMFSRYDFVSESDSDVIGSAWEGTICTPKSVSIVEDCFSFTILEVAAHELGHSLNASHDGDNNQCSSDDQYIMSWYTSVVKGQLNPWNFSTCSIQYFRDLISSLDDQGLNCMANLRDDFDPTALIPEINTLPGTVYDVDEHCRHIVGKGSSFCRHFYTQNNLTDLCTILYCYDTKSGKCEGYLGGDGLSCGNKKWCLSGVCTFSDSAPTKNEECMFGDHPDTFSYEYRTMTCKGGYYSVQNSPDLCYFGDIRRRCCDTCSSVYTGLLGCEYGDRRKYCRREQCLWYSWYTSACCQTCATKNSTNHIKTTALLTSLLSTTRTTSELLKTSTVSKTISNIDMTTYQSSKYSVLTTTATSKLITTSALPNTTAKKESSLTLCTAKEATMKTTISTTGSTASTPTVTLLPNEVSTAMNLSTSTNQSPRITTGTISSSSVSSTSSSSTSSQSQTTLSATLKTQTTLSSIKTLSPTTLPCTTMQPSFTASNPTTKSHTTKSNTTTQLPTTTSSPTTQSPTITSSTTTQSPVTPSPIIQAPTTTSSTTTQSLTTYSTTTQSQITTSSPIIQSPTTTFSTTTQSLTTSSTTTQSQITTSSPIIQSSTTTSSTTTQSLTTSSTTIQSRTTTSSTSTQHVIIKVTQRKMSFQISLNVDEKQDFLSTEEYATVVDYSYKTLFSMYQKQLGSNFRKLQMKSVRLGPLIVDHDIFVENSHSTLVDVVNLLKNISDGKTNVTYNGKDVRVLFVSYTDSTNNQVLINDKTDPEAVIETSFVCTSEESCERTSTTSNADKDDIPTCIIISIAVVTALIVTCAFTITMARMICARKKKLKDRRQYTLVPLQAKVPV